MAIPLSATFNYKAELTQDAISDTEVVLNAVQHPPRTGMRLVGHQPTIRFSNGRLVLVAADSDRLNSTIRMFSADFGDAINYAARAGDTLYIALGSGGDIGLSLLRNERVVMAVGDISAVPLGDFAIPADAYRALRKQDTVEHAGYYLYIEKRETNSFDGTSECASVCLAGDQQARVLTMRAAILLANCGWKFVNWDWSAIRSTAQELEVRMRRSRDAWKNDQLLESPATLVPLARAHSGDAKLQAHVGFVLYDSESTAEAIPYLQAAVAAEPQYALAWRGFLHALWDTGEHGRGLDAARTLAELTTDPEDKQMLASMEKRGGRP
jgi:hypothetical protein